jgi:hypothetical protein
MSMALRAAQWTVAASLLSGPLAACSSDDPGADHTRDESAASSEALTAAATSPASERADDLDDLASAAGAAASGTPVLLMVVNHTRAEVVLTSADGVHTATIEAGESLQFASERVCAWLPLTASTARGDVVERFDESCQGQTWTITGR